MRTTRNKPENNNSNESTPKAQVGECALLEAEIHGKMPLF